MIVVDTNEPEEIYEVLGRFVIVKRYSINTGYRVVVGKRMIECERVLIDDYVSQIDSLDDLIQKFNPKNDFSILFLIGYFFPAMLDTIVRRDTYLNSLAKLLTKKIFPIILETDYDMIIFLKNLHNILFDNEKMEDIKELMNIRGIGYSRAEMLIEKHGSIEEISKLTLAELVECGIGLSTAKEMRKYFGGVYEKDKEKNNQR